MRSKDDELGSLFTRRCLTIYTFRLTRLTSRHYVLVPLHPRRPYLHSPNSPCFRLIPYYHQEVRLAGFETCQQTHEKSIVKYICRQRWQRLMQAQLQRRALLCHPQRRRKAAEKWQLLYTTHQQMKVSSGEAINRNICGNSGHWRGGRWCGLFIRQRTLLGML